MAATHPVSLTSVGDIGYHVKRLYLAESRSDPSHPHVVLVYWDDAARCTCRGWHERGTCAHIDAARGTVREDGT